MTTDPAVNRPQYTQTYRMIVRPYSHRMSYPVIDDNTVAFDRSGHKSLTVRVLFGDHAEWRGPKLTWVCQDNSASCAGPTVEGDETDLSGLELCAHLMQVEYWRISAAEDDYLRDHPTLDGHQMAGYVCE